jgi:hypothetical protein
LAGAPAEGGGAVTYFDSDVTLNPSTNVLTADLCGNIVSKDAEYYFIDNEDNVTAIINGAGMRVNGLMLKEATITEDTANSNALHIDSPHTLYFNRPNGTSVVF